MHCDSFQTLLEHGECDPCLPATIARQVSERALAVGGRAALRAVMRAWLPLSEAVLGMAVERLPDPKQAAPERLPRLLGLHALGSGARLAPALQQVSKSVSGQCTAASCRLACRKECILEGPKSITSVRSLRAADLSQTHVCCTEIDEALACMRS